MKTILFLTILTQLALPQNSKLLLLMDEGFAGIYDGTELITNTIDKGMEVSSLYQSDFSAGVDGWGSASGTVTGNIDGIGGRDNVIRFVYNTASAYHQMIRNISTTNGLIYGYSAYAYISGTNNIGLKTILSIGNNALLSNETALLDTWTFIKVKGTPTVNSANIRAFFYTTTNGMTQDLGGDDTYYFSQFGLSQLPTYIGNGNHSADSSSTNKTAGAYSLVITSTAAGNGTTNTISLASTRFTAVTSGKNYRFQIYAYTSTANTTLTFKLGDIVLTNIVPTTGMSVLNFDFKATASTTGNILLYLDKAATVYIDEASLKAGR